MRTLLPSPLITSPGNILTTDASQYSALPSSPLISQLICAKKKYSVECQTEDMHLKTKDELVGRISELTSRQAGLVDKIQELTRQLDEAKVELNSTINEDSRSPGNSVVEQLTRFVKTNRHIHFVVVNLFHRHDLPPNGLTNREIKRIDENLNILKQERVPIVDVSTFSRKLFTRHGQHLNGLGKNILCGEMLKYLKNVNRQDCVPTHEIASSSTENTLQVAPETQQISATELNGERCQNVDVTATHPAATGDCSRAPVEGRPTASSTGDPAALPTPSIGR
ncbi:hypothetical protein J6590_099102 [Homalodisca vitripennis]|nr:hypothetical protein J6590_099102 [Homalodisca vitripennis]